MENLISTSITPIDIDAALAHPSNEFSLQLFFCSVSFEEFHRPIYDEDGVEERMLFMRLLMDCRDGSLECHRYMHSESYMKQIYRYFEEEYIYVMPVCCFWVNDMVDEYYAQHGEFPLDRMLEYGWTQWRLDAHNYIKREYQKFLLNTHDWSRGCVTDD